MTAVAPSGSVILNVGAEIDRLNQKFNLISIEVNNNPLELQRFRFFSRKLGKKLKISTMSLASHELLLGTI